MKHLLRSALVFLLLCCALPAVAAQPALMQAGVIDALLAGGYQGFYPLDKLPAQGVVGLGTFDALDGEMVLLDGAVYQVPASGIVRKVSKGMLSPFAQAAPMPSPQGVALVGGADLKAVEAALDDALGDLNRFAAVRIDADFASVKTRSVPRQSPPYRPLAEVAKEQSVFPFDAVQGTLVGLRGPAFVKGLGVPGWHWHFLTRDRTRGGHVLEFRLAGSARAKLQGLTRFTLVLPQSGMGGLDLARDRAAELRSVESGK